MRSIYGELYYYLEGLESRIGNYQRKVAEEYIKTSYDTESHHQFAKGNFGIELAKEELMEIRKGLSDKLVKLTGGKYESKLEPDSNVYIKLADIQEMLKLVHRARMNTKNIIETTGTNEIHKYSAYIKSDLYRLIDTIDNLLAKNYTKVLI